MFCRTADRPAQVGILSASGQWSARHRDRSCVSLGDSERSIGKTSRNHSALQSAPGTRLVNTEPFRAAHHGGSCALRQVSTPLASLQRIDAILDEARVHRDRVVKTARDGVGLVRVPEHARRARVLCRIDDGRDQARPNAASPGGLADIEVLEIALRIQKPRAALKQIVSEADKSRRRAQRLAHAPGSRGSKMRAKVASATSSLH